MKGTAIPYWAPVSSIIIKKKKKSPANVSAFLFFGIQSLKSAADKNKKKARNKCEQKFLFLLCFFNLSSLTVHVSYDLRNMAALDGKQQ